MYIYIYTYMAVTNTELPPVQKLYFFRLFVLPFFFFPSFPLDYGPEISFLVFPGTFGKSLPFILSSWGSLWCRSSVGECNQFLLYTGQLRVQITHKQNKCVL